MLLNLTHTHTRMKDRKICTLECRESVQKLKTSHVKNWETRKIVSHQKVKNKLRKWSPNGMNSDEKFPSSVKNPVTSQDIILQVILPKLQLKAWFILQQPLTTPVLFLFRFHSYDLWLCNQSFKLRCRIVCILFLSNNLKKIFSMYLFSAFIIDTGKNMRFLIKLN